MHHMLCPPGVFEDDEVTHIEGDINPVRDLEIIFDELRLKDLEYLQKSVDHLDRAASKAPDKNKKLEAVSFATSSGGL